MTYSVEGSFAAFYEKINLSGDHRATANTRKDDIVKKLSKDFTILDAFASGSIPKFTALSGKADLDIIVALHYGKHIEGKTPTQLLHSVRSSLAEYKTGVRRNGQAVTLSYKTWPSVDIVPVARALNSDGTVDYYNVPNSNNDTWIKSRPKKLSNEIENRSSSSGANFRKIIKYIKHWNSTHSSYLSSYHIEIMALSALHGNLDDTAWNVRAFFEKAMEAIKHPMWYELGFADDYLTAVDREEARKRLSTAYDKSLSAWHHGFQGRDQKAIEAWKQVFGDKFPDYG
ncbi:nucleotidyltransferase domain-containing protein [Lysobacter enzymogenes]|uniref:nucleotidyltransferase domain-containing protein n=1 Tax=Lysobacter enzymogenes TaxID=69 RepID=UPI0019D0926A|nr:nucleotidyltransferase [Lysobacter enzymogenes]